MLTEQENVAYLDILKKISRSVAEKDGRHIPMLCHVDRDGKINVNGLIGLEVDSRTKKGRENKDRLEQMMIDLVKEGAQAIAFISEAWMLTGPLEMMEETKAIYRNGGSISTNPDKIETLNIVFSTPKYEHLAFAKVVRPEDKESFPDGKKIHLEPWQDIRNECMTDGAGRFNSIWRKAHEGKLN